MKEIPMPTPQVVVQEKVVVTQEIAKTTVIPAYISHVKNTEAKPLFDELDQKLPKNEEMSLMDVQALHQTSLSQEEKLAESMPTKSSETEEHVHPLEEGFQSLDAQKAYYEFMESVRLVNIKTGNGAERLIRAIDKVEKHAEEMAIPRLLSIMAVTMPLLLDDLMHDKEKEQKENLNHSQEVTYKDGDEEKQKDGIPEYPHPDKKELFVLPQLLVIPKAA